MDAQHRAISLEGCSAAMDMAGKDQTFKPTPRIADPEMMQSVDKSGNGRFGYRLQFETEQTAGAFEIPFPDGVPGIAGQGGIENPCHLRTGIQPMDELQRGFLMALQPHRQGAKSAQRQEAIIAAGIESHIAMGLLQPRRMRLVGAAEGD